MYALASSGVVWAPAQISWQAQYFWCLPRGSGVRPGVVWHRLGTGADFVAGAALCCATRGRMYALASSGVVWAPARMPWQVHTLVLAKGSDVRPGVVWRRLGTGADFVAGAVLWCLPRGRMYALASSGVGWAPAQISWQVQHFAACHRRRFRGRRSTLVLAKGSDVRPGVVWRRLGTGADFVAGAVLCCVGTPWRRLASAGRRRRLRGRRSTLLLAKGSDVRPGVVGTGADFVAGAAVCVAGAALCCAPRDRTEKALYL